MYHLTHFVFGIEPKRLESDLQLEHVLLPCDVVNRWWWLQTDDSWSDTVHTVPCFWYSFDLSALQWAMWRLLLLLLLLLLMVVPVAGYELPKSRCCNDSRLGHYFQRIHTSTHPPIFHHLPTYLPSTAAVWGAKVWPDSTKRKDTHWPSMHSMK